MFWICLFISFSVPCGCGRLPSSQAPHRRWLSTPRGDPWPLPPAAQAPLAVPTPPRITGLCPHLPPHRRSQGTPTTAGGRRSPRGPGASTHLPNKAHKKRRKQTANSSEPSSNSTTSWWALSAPSSSWEGFRSC